jgi:hypothetical protein
VFLFIKIVIEISFKFAYTVLNFIIIDWFVIGIKLRANRKKLLMFLNSFEKGNKQTKIATIL